MKINLKIKLLFFLICSSISYSQNFNQEAEPVIKLQEEAGDIYMVTASAQNLTETTLNLKYEFSVIKNGRNSSTSTQSNFFSLQPSEIKKLSTSSVNKEEQTEIIILLIFKDENEKIVSTSRKVIAKNEELKKEQGQSYGKKNEGIKLTGFVTENTKTKAGKDFYDFFYQQYLLSGLESDQLISLNETISFGRTTRLNLMVGDRIVHQFFARPKLDFLKDEADKALNQVSRYLQYLKNRNEYTAKY